MSRVSDALQRAAQDRVQLRQRTADSRQKQQPEANTTFDSVKPDRVEAPSAPSPEISASPRLSPEISAPAKSWREKLEEVFFGWDLGRLDSHPLVALEKESAAAEQYRILREQVRTLRNGTGAQPISVTSPLKQDGKTMVAVNLALTLALGGDEQVLLIDADLRSPDVHKYFGVQRSPGLTDYLTSRSNGNLSSYVRATSFSGLGIIPAGTSSDLAGELLAKHRMKRLMEEIRTIYPERQVVIDSPPVLATSDPLVLAREVGGIIMVIRASKTRREYLKKAMEILNSPKLMGIVLNGAQLGAASKYYTYKPV
jgi:protein-tyrosine kinase